MNFSIQKLSKFIVGGLLRHTPYFLGSEQYWQARYAAGGNSGVGSYDALAQFKAEEVNRFVSARKIKTVIEFGCGDGNQLRFSNYPSYIGFDVSTAAIARCEKLFGASQNKKFKLLSKYSGETSELTLSLDVIYHLVEDEVFDAHMKLLFDSSQKFIIIYSSNTDQQAQNPAPHVRHRRFSDWVRDNRPTFNLICHVENPHRPGVGRSILSSSDFFMYEKSA